MIDFTTLQGLTIPEGVVTQITDESGRVIWAVSGGNVILEVEKIVSNTHAGETLYENEEFILLDIYPKTNGTVNVTYGGLTKTITDTSGAEQPNAQQVFFGTFNGVTDSVSTPASGTLTIEGDYYAFGHSSYSVSKLVKQFSFGILEVKDLGKVEIIPANAFGSIYGSSKFEKIKIPNSVTSIGANAFVFCSNLTSITIPNSVTSIGESAFAACTSLAICRIGRGTTYIGRSVFTQNKSLVDIVVDANNEHYSSDGGVLFNKDKSFLHSYPSASGSYTIPNSVISIGANAFNSCPLTSISIPNSVTSICLGAFSRSSLTSATFANTSGWYVTETEGGDISTGTAVDLSDAANNATLLRDTYLMYYWYRS